jgi:hypothetical protein
MIPIDKNGRELMDGQRVRLCQKYEDYHSLDTHLVESRFGPDNGLWIGINPLSFYRNGDTAYHSVEIQ